MVLTSNGNKMKDELDESHWDLEGITRHVKRGQRITKLKWFSAGLVVGFLASLLF